MGGERVTSSNKERVKTSASTLLRTSEMSMGGEIVMSSNNERAIILALMSLNKSVALISGLTVTASRRARRVRTFRSRSLSKLVMSMGGEMSLFLDKKKRISERE